MHLVTALMVWVGVPLLPEAAPPLDMKVVRACLYIAALFSVAAALLQAIAMVRSNRRAIKKI